MITQNTRGESLFHEVFRDYYDSVKKELKKRRDEAREPYVKKKQNIRDILWVNFSYLSPKFNKWYVSSGMVGHYLKPKAANHFHCTTNTGPNGSKLYIILRGNKSATRVKEGKGGGYVVSVTPHVFKRMRERNPEAFGDILDNDKLCEKIFTLEEEGIYYDFDWTKVGKEEQPVQTQYPVSLEEPEKPEWMLKREEVKQQPIILKTLSGLYLGFATVPDRSEVRLITYINESDISDEEEKEIVSQFLIPAWFCYNFQMHDEDEVKETYNKLMKYMEGKDDRNVYRLVI